MKKSLIYQIFILALAGCIGKGSSNPENNTSTKKKNIPNEKRGYQTRKSIFCRKMRNSCEEEESSGYSTFEKKPKYTNLREKNICTGPRDACSNPEEEEEISELNDGPEEYLNYCEEEGKEEEDISELNDGPGEYSNYCEEEKEEEEEISESEEEAEKNMAEDERKWREEYKRREEYEWERCQDIARRMRMEDERKIEKARKARLIEMDRLNLERKQKEEAERKKRDYVADFVEYQEYWYYKNWLIYRLKPLDPPEKIINNTDFSCIICFDEFQAGEKIYICNGSSNMDALEQKHIFHEHCYAKYSCIKSYFARCFTWQCPICREAGRWNYTLFKTGKEDIENLILKVGPGLIEHLMPEIEKLESFTNEFKTEVMFKLLKRGGNEKRICKKIKILIKHGADPNGRDETGVFSFTKKGVNILEKVYYEAVKENQRLYIHNKYYTDLAEFLLKRGADPNIILKSGSGEFWPILVDASKRHPQFAKLLILHGKNINLNAQDRSTGASALINALRNQHNWLAELLLEHGADPNLCTKKGRSPMTYTDDFEAKIKEYGGRKIWKSQGIL